MFSFRSRFTTYAIFLHFQNQKLFNFIHKKKVKLKRIFKAVIKTIWLQYEKRFSICLYCFLSMAVELHWKHIRQKYFNVYKLKVQYISFTLSVTKWYLFVYLYQRLYNIKMKDVNNIIRTENIPVTKISI